MRLSTAPLNGLRRPWQLGEHESHTCHHCDLGLIEDQFHVMRVCNAHVDARARLEVVVRNAWTDGLGNRREWWKQEKVQWDSMGEVQRSIWLLAHNEEGISKAVDIFLVEIFDNRSKRDSSSSSFSSL